MEIDDPFYKQDKLKRHSLGNLHLIAMLHKNNIIPKIVIDRIIVILLDDTTDEAIEMLYKLMTLLPGSLQVQQIKSIKTENIRLRCLLDTTF